MITLQHVPTDQIDANPANPRRSSDPQKIAELTASVKERGVLQPIVVRPVGGRYQTVCGSRRLAAARAAGLETVPSVVREDLDDQTALELAIVENLQREDVDPLDEAEAYRALVDAGLDAVEIGRRLGKSRSHVAGRLRLNGLGPAARARLADGTMTLGAAAVLADLGPAEQDEVVEDLWGDAGKSHWWTPPRPDQVRRVVAQWLCDLSEAPFDVEDATLHPRGACTACPFNSGCNPTLFGTEPALGNCRDVACFNAKQATHIDRRVAQALEDNPSAVKVVGYGAKGGEGMFHIGTDVIVDPDGDTLAVLVAGQMRDYVPGDVFLVRKCGSGSTRAKPEKAEVSQARKEWLRLVRAENLYRHKLQAACLEAANVAPALLAGPAAALVVAKLAESRGTQTSFGDSTHRPAAEPAWTLSFVPRSSSDGGLDRAPDTARVSKTLSSPVDLNAAIVALVGRDEVAVHDYWRHSGYGLDWLADLLGVDKAAVRAEAEAESATKPKRKAKK